MTECKTCEYIIPENTRLSYEMDTLQLTHPFLIGAMLLERYSKNQKLMKAVQEKRAR